jgi:hypothetical protein
MKRILASSLLFCSCSNFYHNTTLSEVKQEILLGYSFEQATLKGNDKNSNADPDRIKLLDGIKNSSSLVIWNTKEFNKKALEIKFNFVEAVKPSLCRVHIFRGLKGYNIKTIEVYGTKQDGKQIVLGGINPEQPYELPKGVPNYSSLDIKLSESEKVNSAILKIDGGHIGITEVEFYSETNETKEKNSSKKSFENAVESSRNGLRLEEKDYNCDHVTDILLENDNVIYIIDVGNGGVVNFAYDKQTGINLIKEKNSKTYGGMYEDRFWTQNNTYKNEFGGQHYKRKIEEQGSERVSVKVWSNGSEGFFQGITISKTFTLLKDSSVLKVDYDIANGQENVIPAKYGLWVMGGFSSQNEEFKRIYPGDSGVQIIPSTKGSYYCPDAVNGWEAIVTSSGNGLANVVDYSILKKFLFWNSDARATTMECLFGIYPIDANSSMETTCYLVPFHGVDVPHGISKDMVGSLSIENSYDVFPEKINLKLLATHPGEYDISVEAGRSDNGKLTYSKITELKKKFSTKAEIIPIACKITEKGTWSFRVSVRENGNTSLMFSTGTTLKKSSGVFTVAPECNKKPEPGIKEEKLNLDFHSIDVQTEHVEWAKPYAGKKPRVLALCRDKHGIREAVEIASRFEMELHTNYVGGIWRLLDYCTSLNEEVCYQELAKKIKSEKFDVFVVSGDFWKTMSPESRELIIKNVENGSGLVLTGPEGLPEEFNKNFALFKASEIFQGEWKSEQEHMITSGIPFKALPQTLALSYLTSGETLATISGKPLISVFSYGKGKVAATSWSVEGKQVNSNLKSASGTTGVFLPVLLFIGNGGVQYNYWEYQIMLLAKMIYWTAGCDFPLEGKGMRVDNAQKLSISLNSKESKNVELELTIRDKFYQIEQYKKVSVSLILGNNDLSVEFNKPSLSGIHFADLIIKGDKGTEWCGSDSFTTESELEGGNIETTNQVWKSNDKFKCSIDVKGKGTGEIRLSLSDFCGNEFASLSKNALPGKIDFELPLANCRWPAFQAKAKIVKDSKLISESRQDYSLFESPDPRIMNVSFGWPSMTTRKVNQFLIKPYWERLQELGANSIIKWNNDKTNEILQGRQLGLLLLAEAAPISTGGKHPYDTTKVIKSKFDLIRTPCLSKPGFKDNLENISSKEIWADKFGYLFRSGPDEANSLGANELCFSEDCQKEFRHWLKEQYGSLDALNKSWESQYRNWDEIIAMTSDEVKGKHSYAPWLDHRTFNEWNYADSINRIIKGTKKYNPKLQYSLSGTQETSAHNAWDWWRLTPHLKSVLSYKGEQSIQRRSFSNGDKINWLPWLGYGNTYEEENFAILNYLFQGANGFSIFSPILYVEADYTFSKKALGLKKALDNYRNGPAEVIINSKLLTYPIAFHYSPASIKVDFVLNMNNSRLGEVGGFNEILSDIGISYDYIAYEQLEKTDILKNKYKVLFLPLSSALSDKEVSTIKEFVKSGGILIGDMLPATYTANGLCRDKSELDEVFGIRHSKLGVIFEDNTIIGNSETVSSMSIADIKMNIKTFETGIELTSGKALANIDINDKKLPALIVNRYGKGTTLYLACDLANVYGKWGVVKYSKDNMKCSKIICSLFENLLNLSAIQAKTKALNPDGSCLQETMYFLKENGHSLTLGIARKPTVASLSVQNGSCQVKIPGKYHVYDLLKGQYIGYGDHFNYDFSPTTQAAFTLLPYKVKGVNLKTENRNDKITLKISVDAETDSFSSHIFKIEVLEPSGKLNRAFSKIVFAENDSTVYEIPIPLNVTKGKWALKVTDCMTGVENTSYIDM